MLSSSRRGWVSGKLNQAVVAFCVACVIVMLAISFAGFFYMILTGDALSWTYSLARLFIPWIGLLSITVAFVRGEHIAMSSLLRMLPSRLGSVLKAVSYVVLALFALMMIWYGWLYFLNSTDIYMVSDQIQIHSRWVAAAVPITGIVLMMHILCGADLLQEPDLLEDVELLAGEHEAGRS